MIPRVVFALLLLGCTERIELLAGMDAVDADACRADACLPPRLCAASLEVCDTAAECCARSCVAGLCAASGGCSVASEPCGEGSDCCSSACAPDETGRAVCQLLGGCAPAGEICQSDEACCDAVSGPGACEIFDASSGVGRCRSPGACARAGELCGAGTECCPGGIAGQDLCRSSGSVTRCVGQAAGTMCLGSSLACASPNECCSRVCAPDDTDRLACLDTCVGNGRGCTRDADCCDRRCNRGICRGGGPSCEPFGASCTSSARCCSGLCGADTATCASRFP